MNKSDLYDVSIIVACYNCEKILEEQIHLLFQTLEKTRYSFEVILVEDGSNDQTLICAQKIMKKYDHISLICHDKNYGRGRTVSDGIKAAKGTVVGFNDIDFSTSPVYIIQLITEILDGGMDVATAWRIYKVSPSVILRWICSKGYHYLVRFFLKLPLKDTETGCKFFRKKDILPILDKIEDEKWFWDTEIMYYIYTSGLKLKEVPTLFLRQKTNKSTVRVLSDSWTYFIKLLKFSYKIRRLPMTKIISN